MITKKQNEDMINYVGMKTVNGKAYPHFKNKQEYEKFLSQDNDNANQISNQDFYIGDEHISKSFLA